jgi:hypothetical protein
LSKIQIVDLHHVVPAIIIKEKLPDLIGTVRIYLVVIREAGVGEGWIDCVGRIEDKRVGDKGGASWMNVLSG